MDDALAEIDEVGGWRALFILPPEAADADALVEALPWVEAGQPRKGTAVRLLQVRSGLALLTGGALSDEEGERLFEMHDQLKDITKDVLIVPPSSAAPPLITKMYDAGVVPLLPSGKVPNERVWAWLAGAMAVGVVTTLRVSIAQGLELVVPVVLGVLAGVFALIYLRQRGKADEVLSDPMRVAATHWAATAPPRSAGSARLEAVAS